MFEFEVALAKRVIVFAKFTTGVFHSIRGNFSILNSAGIKIRQLFSFFKTRCSGNKLAKKYRWAFFIGETFVEFCLGARMVGEQLDRNHQEGGEHYRATQMGF